MQRFLKGTTALTGPLAAHLGLIKKFGMCPFPAHIQMDMDLAVKLGLTKPPEEKTDGSVQ